MAEPEADRGDVSKGQEAFGSLVVAGGDTTGILELVEPPFDQVAKLVEDAVHGDAQSAGLAHRDHRGDVTHLRRFASLPASQPRSVSRTAGSGRLSSMTKWKAQ